MRLDQDDDEPGDAQSTHLARLRKIDDAASNALASNAPYNPPPGVYWLHDADLVRTRNALLIGYADTSGAGMTSELADQELDNILRPL